MENVKNKIIDALQLYTEHEFGEDIEITPDVGSEEYGVMFTNVYEDEECLESHEMQVSIDLRDFTVKVYIDGELITRKSVEPSDLLNMSEMYGFDEWYSEGLDACPEGWN